MSSALYLRSFRLPTRIALSFPSLSHLLRVSLCTLKILATSLRGSKLNDVELLPAIMYNIAYIMNMENAR